MRQRKSSWGIIGVHFTKIHGQTVSMFDRVLWPSSPGPFSLRETGSRSDKSLALRERDLG